MVAPGSLTYFRALASLLEGRASWRELHAREAHWAARLALVHPAFYPPTFDPRGRRTFVGVGRRRATCEAERLHRYVCPFNKARIQRDHWFPYSLGGPTIGSNEIYLCDVHNSAKSNDVHVFPFDEPEPDWIESVIDQLARRRPRSQ